MKNQTAQSKELLEIEILDREKSPLEEWEELEEILETPIIRVDTDESIRLVINLDQIEKMPSGTCVSPFPYQQKDEAEIIVCREEDKIKIFKMLKKDKIKTSKILQEEVC